MNDLAPPPFQNPTKRVWNWPLRIERGVKSFMGYIVAPLITVCILFIMSGVLAYGALRARLKPTGSGPAQTRNKRHRSLNPHRRRPTMSPGQQQGRKSARLALMSHSNVCGKNAGASSMACDERTDATEEHLHRDLAMCRTPAAIAALLEEPNFRATLNRRGREKLLTHLADIGANIAQTADVLSHLGLMWLYQAPINQRIIALRDGDPGGQFVWSHEARSVVCFEAWRGRLMLEKTSGRPKSQLFAYFDKNGQLIHTYTVAPMRFL